MNSFHIENDLKKFTWKQLVGIAVGLYFLYLIAPVFIGSSSSTNPSSASVAPSSQSIFASEARARFDDIARISPELDAIRCEGDCSAVVYFDYKTLPDDLNFAMRGNASTFSKFKMERTGVSHVSVTARLAGREILTCRASGGIVSECN